MRIHDWNFSGAFFILLSLNIYLLPFFESEFSDINRIAVNNPIKMAQSIILFIILCDYFYISIEANISFLFF